MKPTSSNFLWGQYSEQEKCDTTPIVGSAGRWSILDQLSLCIRVPLLHQRVDSRLWGMGAIHFYHCLHSKAACTVPRFRTFPWGRACVWCFMGNRLHHYRGNTRRSAFFFRCEKAREKLGEPFLERKSFRHSEEYGEARVLLYPFSSFIAALPF